MGEAAKLQEITEDGKKADAQRGFAQEEIRVKQQVKVCVSELTKLITNFLQFRLSLKE